MVYALIQEGGTSDELYLHVHDTMEEAEADRRSCAKGAYRTTEPIEVPELGESAWSAIDELLQALPTLDYPDDTEDEAS